MNEIVQTSEPAVEKYTEGGITIRRRGAKFVTRIKFRGKTHWITLAETAKESFRMAVLARRDIHAERWAQLKESTALRVVKQVTCSDLFTTVRKFVGPDRPATTTTEQNINALCAIVREVLGADTDVEQLPLASLKQELLWKWKEGKRQLATQADDDERSLQILRSANSRMRQAKSLFSANEDLQTFYRMHKLVVPDCVAGFCKEPPFGDCSKDEYHAPSDAIVAATLSALDAMPSSPNFDRNVYMACWMAIGFGLRRGEISKAKNSWFVTIDGVTYCRGDELAKNKKFPEVRVQLGAWDKIKPYLKGEVGEHVLSGTETERTDDTFRRVSEFMRKLGWQTTHHLHELRAWAGCQIAMAPGNDVRDAQVFLRHAQFGTTEKFYGHHMKVKLAEVKLTLPAAAKPFVPQILPAATA